ncbi:aldo/keto reductase [Winkia sp. UMB3158]|uniref:NADP-dependent oxidoreductase domain-containing protein n=3 Tax=Winkia neuii TaxID=33007 RepID=K0YS68_9ACTO|nr:MULTISPECIES: aldo/keto reductase [Winkia]MDK8342028.1 aldo/keto reductase [Winkia sp. UMB3164B]OFT38937.1 oxidoreductase [Actinomyces sp. HMSC08A01]PLB80501.1 aldo/keto reductase [Actinomyces sp. UMB0138]PMC92721.1 aldo/keto reductase [Actinomyces sp. UMB0918]EJZ86607.1 hypothetical protein HMPREF9240_00981 [Winkia neuii BV029A5]
MNSALKIPTKRTMGGYSIPYLGFGTYKIAPEDTQRLVETALEAGIRHIDTAQMYGNEKQVGAAIAASGIPRYQIFLTTKLNNGNHLSDDARRSFEQSLADLQTDYVDLFLMHWPMVHRYGGRFPECFQMMQDFSADGSARTVGVSNFEVEHLERLRTETGLVPHVNQIEMHPLFANNKVLDYCAKHRIVVQAWSPLARGKILEIPEVQTIATRLERTPAQVALRWALQRGVIVFPKSSSRERIEENANIFDFSLDEESMRILNNLDKGEAGRTGSSPQTMDRI